MVGENTGHRVGVDLPAWAQPLRATFPPAAIQAGLFEQYGKILSSTPDMLLSLHFVPPTAPAVQGATALPSTQRLAEIREGMRQGCDIESVALFWTTSQRCSLGAIGEVLPSTEPRKPKP